MSGSLILWMSLALVVFWSVGVYNRLMRMRARGLGALGSVMKHMRVYTELLRGIAQQPSSMEQPGDAWTHWLANLKTLEQMLQDATASSLMQGSPATLGRAFDAVHSMWRQFGTAPLDGALEGSQKALPAVLGDQVQLAALRVGTARDGFNQLLTKYNEALEQFPASLVVTTMGFKPGELL